MIKPGLSATSRGAAASLHHRRLRQHALEWLVSLLREVSVKLADLGRLGDEIFVRGLEVFRLYLPSPSPDSSMSFSRAAADSSNDFFE